MQLNTIHERNGRRSPKPCLGDLVQVSAMYLAVCLLHVRPLPLEAVHDRNHNQVSFEVGQHLLSLMTVRLPVVRMTMMAMVMVEGTNDNKAVRCSAHVFACRATDDTPRCVHHNYYHHHRHKSNQRTTTKTTTTTATATTTTTKAMITGGSLKLENNVIYALGSPHPSPLAQQTSFAAYDPT